MDVWAWAGVLEHCCGNKIELHCTVIKGWIDISYRCNDELCLVALQCTQVCTPNIDKGWQLHTGTDNFAHPYHYKVWQLHFGTDNFAHPCNDKVDSYTQVQTILHTCNYKGWQLHSGTDNFAHPATINVDSYTQVQTILHNLQLWTLRVTLRYRQFCTPCNYKRWQLHSGTVNFAHPATIKVESYTPVQTILHTLQL